MLEPNDRPTVRQWALREMPHASWEGRARALEAECAEARALLQKALTAIALTDGDLAMEGLAIDGRLDAVGTEIAAWLNAREVRSE